MTKRKKRGGGGAAGRGNAGGRGRGATANAAAATPRSPRAEPAEEEPSQSSMSQQSGAGEINVNFSHSFTGEGEGRFGLLFQQINLVPTGLGDLGEDLGRDALTIPGKQVLRAFYNKVVIDEVEGKTGIKLKDCPMLSESGTLVQPFARIEDNGDVPYSAPFVIDRVLCSLDFFTRKVQLCKLYSYTIVGKKAVRFLIENLDALHKQDYYFPYLRLETIFVVSSIQGKLIDYDEKMVKKEGTVEGVKVEEMTDDNLSFYFAFGFLSSDSNKSKEDNEKLDWTNLRDVLRDLRCLQLQREDYQFEKGDLDIFMKNEMTDIEDRIQQYGLSRDATTRKKVFEHPSLLRDSEKFTYVGLCEYALGDIIARDSNPPSKLIDLGLRSSWPLSYQELRDKLELCTGRACGQESNHEIKAFIRLLRNVWAHYDEFDSYLAGCRHRANHIDSLMYQYEPLLFVSLWEYMMKHRPSVHL